MQRHTCFRRTLHDDDDSESTLGKEKKSNKSSVHNIDVNPCTHNRKVFAIVGEAQVRDGLPETTVKISMLIQSNSKRRSTPHTHKQ
jgi:hypothetical protein